MAPVEYRYERNLIRAGDGVFELFAMGVSDSWRFPIAWAAAGLEPQKHDMVRVELGKAVDLDGPFFARPAIRNAAFTFEVPATEEPRLRGFLLAAARSVGRSP